MKKVHILRWSSRNGLKEIYKVHLDYKKAYQVASSFNKKRHWVHRLFGCKWVIQSFDVEE